MSSLANLAVDFTATDYTLDGRTVFRYECSLISIPGHFRVKCVLRVTGEDGIETSTTEWQLLRPDGYFVISEKGEGQFLLQSMHDDLRSPESLGPATPLVFLMTPVRALLYPFNQIIRGEMVDAHSVKVKAFRRQPESRDAAFVLQTTNWSSGTISEFQLNDRWLVSRLSVESSTGIRLLREISYTFVDDRMVPSRISLKRTEKSGRVLQPGFLAEFQNYKVYRGSPMDFSLKQFGLPEPMGASSIYQSGGSRWWLWITLAAVGSAGLAVLWAKLGGRFQHTAAAKIIAKKEAPPLTPPAGPASP